MALLCLAIFCNSSMVWSFSSSNTNATHNNGWSYSGAGNSQSGTPNISQNNTFDRGTNTGAPALTVVAGDVDCYNLSGTHTNTIIGNLSIAGGIARFQNDGAGSVINTIDGVSASGNSVVWFWCQGSGSATNGASNARIAVTVSDSATVDFSNNNGAPGTAGIVQSYLQNVAVSGSGFLGLGSASGSNAPGSLSDITGGLSVIDTGRAEFYNKNSGTASHTIDSVNLNGTMLVGGNGATTTVDSLDWGVGTLECMLANGSFGSTTFANAIITTPELALVDSSSNYLTGTVGGTLLNVLTTTNPASGACNITLSGSNTNLSIAANNDAIASTLASETVRRIYAQNTTVYNNLNPTFYDASYAGGWTKYADTAGTLSYTTLTPAANQNNKFANKTGGAYGLVVSSGTADLSNNTANMTTNVVTGGIRVTGGLANFSNTGASTIINTIDSLRLEGGTYVSGGITIIDSPNSVFLTGGNGSTTNIGLFDLQGGEIQCVLAGNSFGPAIIAHANINAGAVGLVDSGGYSLASQVSGLKVLFVADTVTGPCNIFLANGNSQSNFMGTNTVFSIAANNDAIAGTIASSVKRTIYAENATVYNNLNPTFYDASYAGSWTKYADTAGTLSYTTLTPAANQTNKFANKTGGAYGLVVSSGTADLSNNTSYPTTNVVTGGTHVTGGVANFCNLGSGTVTNTLGATTLDGGTLRVGGNDATTTMSTMTWSGGEFQPMLANGSFGTTTFTNAVIGTVTLGLVDGNGAHLTGTVGGTLLNVLTTTNPASGACNITLSGSNTNLSIAANNDAIASTLASETVRRIYAQNTSVYNNLNPTFYDASYAGGWTKYADTAGSEAYVTLTPAASQNNKFANKTGGAYGLVVSSGTANVYNSSTKTVSNVVTGGLSITGGTANFYNSSSGALTNTIDSVALSGGTLRATNSSSGTVTNTFTTTATLSSGTLRVGGNGATTTMLTMTWSGGELQSMLANGSFGMTTFTNAVIGTVTLGLVNSSGNYLTSTVGGTFYTVLTDPNGVSGGPVVLSLSGSNTGFTIGNNDVVSAQLAASAAPGIFVTGTTVYNNLIPTFYDASYAGSWTTKAKSDGSDAYAAITPGANRHNVFAKGAGAYGLTVSSGVVSLNNNGATTTSNTVTGGMSVTGGTANFYNASTGTLTNTISGGVTMSGGTANFYNSGSGTLVNTIDTLNLQGGTFVVGGHGATTNITTMNWSGGTLQCAYDPIDNSFGSMTIDNLNVTGPVTISLWDDIGNQSQTSSIAGPVQIFTVGTFTGDPNNISVHNSNNPFQEVVPTPSNPKGVYVNGTTVYVNLASASTAIDTSPEDSLTSAIDSVLSVQNAANQNALASFAPSIDQRITRTNVSQHLRENKQDPFEAMVSSLVESDVKISKFKGDYRVWMSPFATSVKNNGLGSPKAAYCEKYYGVLMGASHFVKNWDTNVTGLIGFGASKSQMASSFNSNTVSKNLFLGGSFDKKITQNIEMLSSLFLMMFNQTQSRQANPDPSQSYVAKSKYKTFAASTQNEFGYIMKLDNGFSLRPCVGLQFGASQRQGYKETNIPANFAHSYRTQTSFGGEVYTGMGVRHKWVLEDYESKLTFTYNIGRKSGNDKSKTTVYAASVPEGMTISSKKPGRVVHYFNLYGSVLDLKSNWKIVPGVTASVQKGQKSATFTFKVEHRF